MEILLFSSFRAHDGFPIFQMSILFIYCEVFFWFWVFFIWLWGIISYFCFGASILFIMKVCLNFLSFIYFWNFFYFRNLTFWNFFVLTSILFFEICRLQSLYPFLKGVGEYLNMPLRFHLKLYVKHGTWKKMWKEWLGIKSI